MKKVIIHIFIFLILILIPNYCVAKIITDDSGLITFETSNKWHISSFGEDPLTYELICITYDNNTGIKLTQSKYPMKYRNLQQANNTEISELRDYMIRYYINLFKSKGYTFKINKTECLQNSIIIGASIERNGFTGKMITTTYIKDYRGYIITAFCSDATVNETYNTLKTLKINGVNIDEWMQ